LTEKHAIKLTAYVQDLRAFGRGEVPDFGPLDGGDVARVPFLFEKPGPRTSVQRGRSRGGSGFISRDNDDPTAEAIFHFMRKAGLDRRETTIWNMVPWWNGTRAIGVDELCAGMNALDDLLRILASLQVVVLVGRKASRALSRVEESGLPVLESARPSPTVRASRPNLWKSIPEKWAEALPFVRQSG
jgi:hypothetical protein